MDVVVEAAALHKRFAAPGLAKLGCPAVHAVADLSFTIARNEVVGFLGPNGAGKSTTLGLLTGLLRPTAGAARLFGRPAQEPAARARLGFLPESPSFPPHLTPLELLDLCGRLGGLDPATRRRRAAALVERLGLGEVAGRPLAKLSKGTTQRLGLAQALVHQPDLVVLDEPMAGLDPLWRKEARDLVLELKRAGKTVLFSTHILPDVELVCDRVLILVGGRLRGAGRLEGLVAPRLLHTELVVARGGRTELRRLPAGADVAAALRQALDAGEEVVALTPRTESLEDLFLREAAPSSAASA